MLGTLNILNSALGQILRQILFTKQSNACLAQLRSPYAVPFYKDAAKGAVIYLPTAA